MELKLALAASGSSRARPGRCHLPGVSRDGGCGCVMGVWCSVRHEKGGMNGWVEIRGLCFGRGQKERHVSLAQTKVAKWPTFPL